MKKLTKKEANKLKIVVEEMTGKLWEDIAPCDVIHVIQMLGELADDLLCKIELFPKLPKDLPGRKRK